MFDNGEVLPDLDKPWTFVGATAPEWLIGFSVFVLISVFAPNGMVGRMLPFMIGGWVTTTYTLGSLRRLFPDGEKGMRNYFTTLVGIPPMNIPAPASLQPIWSATLVKELPKRSDFMQIGLHLVFPIHKVELEEPDDSLYLEDEGKKEIREKV
ncbi:MAG: hypothetical protein LBE20_06875 [Deltaproteobacteria bacterium]|jgi:hypothetical protein|nr:hypothetical protein [Deltaproteobacteria bacterium]